jgi:hypothetical protein
LYSYKWAPIRQESYDVPRVRSEPPYAASSSVYRNTHGWTPSLQIPFSKQIKDDLPPSMSSRSFRRQEGQSCVGRRQDKTRSTNNCSQVKKENNRQDKTRQGGKARLAETIQHNNRTLAKEKTRQDTLRQDKARQNCENSSLLYLCLVRYNSYQYGYPEKVLCTQYPSTRCSTPFFSRTIGKSI